MNTTEATSLAKMAVSVTIFALCIGAVISLFYFLYGSYSQRVKTMEDAANSYSTERLYELSEASRLSDSGGVTIPNVVTALRSYDEDELLFIYIKAAEDSDTNLSSAGSVYTYDGGGTATNEDRFHKASRLATNNSALKPSAAGGSQPTVKASKYPVTEATKFLSAYSDRNCLLEMKCIKYKPDGTLAATNAISDWHSGANGALGICITISKGEVL